MPPPRCAPYGRTMLLRRGTREQAPSAHEGDLPWIYGAAIRAASGEETAARATVAAFSARSTNGHSNGARRRALMIAAVRNALADSPSEPLDRLPADEREAVGLARILGLDVREVAAVQEREVTEVKALMRNGLTRLAAAYYP
jgi:DNA-directed RNA polymerase specialized sigma24 family protein